MKHKQWIKNLFSDPRLANLPFAGSPIPVFIVVASYLWIVTGKGQKWMEGRKPFELTKLINCYNILQVFANTYVFYKVRWSEFR